MANGPSACTPWTPPPLKPTGKRIRRARRKRKASRYYLVDRHSRLESVIAVAGQHDLNEPSEGRCGSNVLPVAKAAWKKRVGFVLEDGGSCTESLYCIGLLLRPVPTNWVFSLKWIGFTLPHRRGSCYCVSLHCHCVLTRAVPPPTLILSSPSSLFHSSRAVRRRSRRRCPPLTQRRSR